METGRDLFHRGPPVSSHCPPSLEGFRISQVQLADSGVFTCVAASPAGVADRNFTLQVHGERGEGVGESRLLRATWPLGLICSVAHSFISQVVIELWRARAVPGTGTPQEAEVAPATRRSV